MLVKRKLPRNLKILSASVVKSSDLADFPKMTGWFEPVLLLKLFGRVIVSDVFGQYADRRLIEAALDQLPDAEHLKRALSIAPKEGPMWIDYVSDLGDGFDATYAIAYLLAQPTLTVEGRTLARGDALVMGGDEVYPTARRDDYLIKLRRPYEFALPATDAPKIPLFVIPGNHDWYDGLVNFLAIFCREKRTIIGGWRTVQRRSYFAARVTEDWWLWGIDIALVRDMDQPQANYFTAIAQGMPENANVILCSAEPGWYDAEKGGNSYRTLSYAARIADDAKKNLKIPLVLSGDSHHYARYSGAGTEYVTSGGGGAFLHGTHGMKDRIGAEWLRDSNAVLQLKHRYPSPATSSDLLKGNKAFGSLNRELTLTLGCLYLVLALS